MLKIIKVNQTGKRLPAVVDEKKWLGAVVKLLKKSDWVVPEKGMIEFYLVNQEEIRALNKQYRDKDKETDVLSFGFMGEEKFPGDDMVGQIFLCPEIANKQAMERKGLVKEEMEFLLVHALLHVFGMDHESQTDFQKMFNWQLQLFPETKWRDYVELISLESFGSK